MDRVLISIKTNKDNILKQDLGATALVAVIRENSNVVQIKSIYRKIHGGTTEVYREIILDS